MEFFLKLCSSKETARRFKDNSEITVTATAPDREFSATKLRYWLQILQLGNKWNAAGKEITWDMIH
jgi:preprotein translocase subunit SecA